MEYTGIIGTSFTMSSVKKIVVLMAFQIIQGVLPVFLLENRSRGGGGGGGGAES